MIYRATMLLMWGVLWAAEPVAQLHLKVSMRDGVKLCTNVFRPAGQGRFPTLVQRTPYGKGAAEKLIRETIALYNDVK